MIPNHAQFLESLKEKKKVRVQFYSQPDSGVLDRVFAPMDYGPGHHSTDGRNRYWLWDYASETGKYTLGLAPQQIVDLHPLGEAFDPAQFTLEPTPASVAQKDGLPPAPVATAGGPVEPGL